MFVSKQNGSVGAVNDVNETGVRYRFLARRVLAGEKPTGAWCVVHFGTKSYLRASRRHSDTK